MTQLFTKINHPLSDLSSAYYIEIGLGFSIDCATRARAFLVPNLITIDDLVMQAGDVLTLADVVLNGTVFRLLQFFLNLTKRQIKALLK